MNVTVEAPAKINLTLDVVGRRDDGYHLVETVMQAVDLCDRVTVRRTDKPGAVSLLCDDARVPDGRTIQPSGRQRHFFAACGLPNPGVEIGLRKRIPLQAGLAGGSADAAGTLVAPRPVDGYPDDRRGTLCAVAETVGADVPFCVLGAAAYAEGIGTILTPLPSLPDCAVVIAKPLDGVSTAEAYRLVDRAALTRRPHTGAAVDAVCAGDLAAVAHGLCNVFEEALALPGSGGDRAGDAGTRDARLSYDRKRVGGLRPFDNEEAARRCAAALRRDYDEVFQCRPCPSRAAIGSPGGREGPGLLEPAQTDGGTPFHRGRPAPDGNTKFRRLANPPLTFSVPANLPHFRGYAALRRRVLPKTRIAAPSPGYGG